ncbi:hypothetical protein [Pseudomonas sp. MS19]|uniref:hypothetical protein n=1 Tax=Pseudomonas sp. MS19 TaxID=2579939 RepID=UPI001561FA25|nr:hypothetical protein [Pseudomonas sp. MS19]NRH28880.1 hypothetical protein [Pseudomonas sp. MS19]
MTALTRLCLRLLIGLTLAFNGMAQAETHMPCPMQASEQNAMHTQHMMDAMDCCNDAADHQSSKTPCKDGQDCSSANIVLPLPGLTTPLAFSAQRTLSTYQSFIPAKTPSGVWRPPRA